jgi:hypothetical protein
MKLCGEICKNKTCFIGNFSYEFVRVTENILEPRGKDRGLISYLLEDVE